MRYLQHAARQTAVRKGYTSVAASRTNPKRKLLSLRVRREHSRVRGGAPGTEEATLTAGQVSGVRLSRDLNGWSRERGPALMRLHVTLTRHLPPASPHFTFPSISRFTSIPIDHVSRVLAVQSEPLGLRRCQVRSVSNRSRRVTYKLRQALSSFPPFSHLLLHVHVHVPYY